MALIRGRWERVTYERRLFKVDDTQILPEDPSMSPVPLYMLAGREITTNLECPSMVFVILHESQTNTTDL